jgi:hypothetical protein
MPAIFRRLVCLVVVLLAAGAGALVGFVLTSAGHGLAPSQPKVLATYPLPHQVPRYPGGVALSFAMVHDVIHERYARHGKAYYRERDRQVRQTLKKQKNARPGDKPSPRYLELLDDLGVGLDQLGRHDEAVRLMRDKLKEQEAAGLKGRELYTTYANLGTFLIHGNFASARNGNSTAKERLREGLGFLRRSIEVNPQAHFGREIWQAVVVTFFLAAMDRPELLLKYDLVGNLLSEDAADNWGRALHVPREKEASLMEAIPELDGWMNPSSQRIGRILAACLEAPDEQMPAPKREGLRRCVTHLSPMWQADVNSSHRTPVPFDEPVLGVIGMWRLGGGANPHFALMLGETMMRVGQRHIAWSAYERAIRLEERFWPDAEIRRRFVAHCRGRQKMIEAGLPATEREELPDRFEQELANGQSYQQAYQRYEEERIAAGASLDDPHFYDDFHARHGKIASPPGDADFFDIIDEESLLDRIALPILGAGLFAFVAAVVLRLWLRRATHKRGMAGQPIPAG